MAGSHFVTMTDEGRAEAVAAMMRALYAEDNTAEGIDAGHFPRTIRTLVNDPGRGCIILFMEEGGIFGYAILIPFWSNEFGGTLLHVDELYVMPEARNRGIGRAFFKFLDDQRPYEAVAVALEASSANVRARSLYESLGFVPRPNTTLTHRFEQRR